MLSLRVVSRTVPQRSQPTRKRRTTCRPRAPGPRESTRMKNKRKSSIPRRRMRGIGIRIRKGSRPSSAGSMQRAARVSGPRRLEMLSPATSSETRGWPLRIGRSPILSSASTTSQRSRHHPCNWARYRAPVEATTPPRRLQAHPQTSRRQALITILLARSTNRPNPSPQRKRRKANQHSCRKWRTTAQPYRRGTPNIPLQSQTKHQELATIPLSHYRATTWSARRATTT